jgi:methionyl-tRNA synthetase
MKAFGIDQRELELYARANSGAKAQKMINVLQKTHGFIEAFENPIGQEVLLDALQISEAILDKIVEETATDAERAEFRALKKIISRWQDISNKHNETLNELTKPKGGS